MAFFNNKVVSRSTGGGVVAWWSLVAGAGVGL